MNCIKYQNDWKIDGCVYGEGINDATVAFKNFCFNSKNLVNACGNCIILNYRIKEAEWFSKDRGSEQLFLKSGAILTLFEEEHDIC